MGIIAALQFTLSSILKYCIIFSEQCCIGFKKNTYKASEMLGKFNVQATLISANGI